MGLNIKILILSHFHALIGPQIFLIAPESFSDDDLKKIPALMDLYDNGFFVHMFGKFKSANYIFDIPNEHARGKIEVLQISFLVDIKSNINFTLSEELLEGFTKEFNKIENVHEALYVDSVTSGKLGFDPDPEKLKEVQALFSEFFKSFPEESVMYERKDARILVFGLTSAGKTTIINCQRNMVSKKTLPTTYIDISRILVNNLSIFTHDTPGQLRYRELWTPYLKNQEGLVFVLDIADTENFDAAREILHDIALMPQMHDLPLLILFNKVDLIKPDVNFITDLMKIDELGTRTMKYFLTSGLKNQNIDEAFQWLALKLSERAFPSPKSDIGIIFSRWNEKVGADVVAVHPNDFFDDSEVIALRCFSLSQFIFGGENFKRISVILPFTHLKVNAAIYFDFVPSSFVRGGLLPLSLVIFYNEKIPRAVINQFNIVIFEEFSRIKEHHSNRTHIIEDLKRIHSILKKRINSFKPIVQALRIEELRYQSLFKAARDALLIIDRKSGIIVDANDQSEKLLQLPLEDLIGLHINQISLENGVENFKDLILNQIKHEYAPPLDLLIQGPNRKAVPIEINANEIQLGGQNVIQCILRDITERKRAEKILKESEKKYRHLFENSPFSITLINLKGVIIDCNPATEQQLGFKREDLIGKKYGQLSIIHPKDKLILEEKIKKAFMEGIQNILDIKVKNKEGEFISVNLRSSTVKICNETFIQIITHDISKQKEAEQIIKDRLKFERIISNISSRFVVLHDIYFAIEDSLSEMGRMTGASRVYLFLFNKEKTLLNYTNEWCADGVKSIIKSLHDIPLDKFPWWTEKLKKMEFIQIKDISSLPKQARAIKGLLKTWQTRSLLVYPLQISQSLAGFIGFDDVEKSREWKESDHGMLGIFAEILRNALERKRAEEALKESEEKFHKAYDRENFYKELFTNDINNILVNVQALLHVHSKFIEDPKKAQNLEGILENVREENARGIQLVSNIQKLASLEDSSISIEKMDLYLILKKSIELIQEDFIERDINISINAPGKKFFVFANEILIDVFKNILKYAISYSIDSEIDLHIKISKLTKERIDYLRVEFIISKSVISEIKNAEISQKDSRGVLLGFSLAEKFLDRIDGHIWVEGNDFIIEIPEAPQD